MSSQAVKTWRQNTKHRMVQAMGGKCVICGYNRCMDAFDLHHLDPAEKEFGFGGMRASPKAWSTIVAELKKCVLLCAICHREVHAGIATIPEDAPSFDPAWEDYARVVRESKTTPCPICGKLKRSSAKHCSLSCAGKARNRVDWDHHDLPKLLETMSKSAIARMLGISDMAVRKHLKKMARRVGLEPTMGFPPTD